ncbi:MAG: hypothetical protein M3381_11115 [Actinomycetota bacterium]|nr:hypothetical protein [Actinomycetota bacterium]
MPKTIQIRDVDDDVYRALARRAAEKGISVPELLRREARKLAERPSMSEWLDRLSPSHLDISNEEVLAALDEHRGPWPEPDAGR